MSKLVKIPYKDGHILVEVETAEGEIVPVGKKGERIVEQAKESLEKAENIIINGCALLSGSLKKLAEKDPLLESASMEFSLQFTAEGNAYIVKTSAQGSIKVSINLRLK